jgi:peptidoglycan/LPS O-acetylase OafA/YrhL
LFHGAPAPPLEAALIQLRTFGVPLFFVCSAFLMAAGLARPASSLQGYWKSRLRQVAMPWLLWVGVFEGLALTKFCFRHGLDLHGIIEQSWRNVFDESYWFVPILLVSLAMLLPLYRYWPSWWLGLVFWVLSLFYGLNLYSHWVMSSHSVAIFGYLFPLWLGIQLFHHVQRLQAWLQRLPWGLILAIFCLSVTLMYLEERMLLRWGIPNTYNALQLSNQVYALVVLMVCMKLRVRLMPAWIDVRKDSYGIYLSHPLVASFGRGVINLTAGLSGTEPSLFMRLPTLIHNPYTRMGLIFVWFIMIYAMSLLITKALRMTPLAWTVGVTDIGPIKQKYHLRSS